jgi:hypothetical protein
MTLVSLEGLIITPQSIERRAAPADDSTHERL